MTGFTRPPGPAAGAPPDLSFCRTEFPALVKKVKEHRVVFLDAPGGTQVPWPVIDRMTHYLAAENANTHGAFKTSRATDRVIAEGRETLADFLGAAPEEIAFGQNMTTLNFALSRAIGRDLGPGDEIVITDLDHEANRGPWQALEEKDVVVRSAAVDPETAALDLDDLRSKITGRTRVVAVTGASNAVGTIPDVKLITGWAHEVGALYVVDAVHLAAHKPINVGELGCDYLLCSAYKFFGPHIGVLYGRQEAFERLRPYKLIPQSDAVPFRLETGTLNHEGIAGATAAVEFIAHLGREAAGVGHATDARRGEFAPGLEDRAENGRPGQNGGGNRNRRGQDAARPGGAPSEKELSRRQAVVAGMTAIDAYEGALAERFRERLEDIEGLRIYGPPKGRPRTPTISFRLEGHSPEETARFLAEKGVFVWSGDFYASTLLRRLGLADGGGLVRMGLAPYNTADELDRVAELLAEFAVSS